MNKTQADGTHMSQRFEVSLQWYAADQGHDNYNDSSNTCEGAYLLKPDRWQRWQYPYSRLDYQYDTFNGTHLKQWTFNFADALNR